VLPLSILCGGLDHQIDQIEHHLFPTLAPPRLREIAPRVQQICERYGVAYRKDTWPTTLRKALGYVGSLSHGSGPGPVREVSLDRP
jgi:NADPH-dependent stearoyl-CoA 9-desaturase